MPGTSAAARRRCSRRPRTPAPQVASAQIVGGNSILLRTGQLTNGQLTAVQDAVASAAGVSPSRSARRRSAPQWGHDITDKALHRPGGVPGRGRGASWPSGSSRRWRSAAIAALFHDLLLTAGVYSLVGFEVTPSTVIGLLTILGFSLYDTVVVFDKVDENTKGLASAAPG